MDPLSFAVLVVIAAFATAKVITNYRIDREYARQGLDSPRMRLKLAKAARGEATAESVARTRPGATGYFLELWNDAWADATDRHRARKAAKEAGVVPPERHSKPWWRYLFDPIGEDQPSPAPPAPAPQTKDVPQPQPTAAKPRTPVRPQPATPAPQPFPHQATPEQSPAPNPRPEPEPTPDTGDDMATNTATGDVHDVESCDSELDALTDDLTAIDTALDVIDENIRSARSSTELIEAFLAGKNVDGEVLAGMAQALDMLGPEAIKNLIDSIAAAKAGVQATKEAMGPLREASELVGAADGSVLNGR